VFQALPEVLQGEVMTGARGVHPRVERFARDDVFLVAAAGSIAACKDRRVIYVEHGAGQSYVGGRHAASYPGGDHPANVIGYVCPSEQVALSWRGRPAVAVGCPALDPLATAGRGEAVVFTFHWDAPLVCPEARSARSHYLDHLHEMVTWARETGRSRGDVIGTWHPRDRMAAGIWRSLRVPAEPDPDRVLRQAALVIADNTSLTYEAAALGIPTIALNAPWYRRDVDHGLRFWSHVPGLQVDDAYELIARPALEWITDERTPLLGKRAARRAYALPPNSGGAAIAAGFITDLIS
jgi:hypothetical protein